MIALLDNLMKIRMNSFLRGLIVLLRGGKETKGYQKRNVWIRVHNPKPATIYANIKTHKTDYPYWLIMSAQGTATEFLAKWIECKLKPYAQLRNSYISDTKVFCNIWKRLMILEHL